MGRNFIYTSSWHEGDVVEITSDSTIEQIASNVPRRCKYKIIKSKEYKDMTTPQKKKKSENSSINITQKSIEH